MQSSFSAYTAQSAQEAEKNISACQQEHHKEACAAMPNAGGIMYIKKHQSAVWLGRRIAYHMQHMENAAAFGLAITVEHKSMGFAC